MKKAIILTLLLFLASGIYIGASARTQYDSTGRHIIYNDTIRGRKQAAYERMNSTRAAAAAKVDYENESKAVVESQKPKSNYYHSSEKYKNRNMMPENTIRGRKQAAYRNAIQNKAKTASESEKANNTLKANDTSKAENNVEPKTLNNKPEAKKASAQEPKEAPVQEVETAQETEKVETTEKVEE